MANSRIAQDQCALVPIIMNNARNYMDQVCLDCGACRSAMLVNSQVAILYVTTRSCLFSLLPSLLFCHSVLLASVNAVDECYSQNLLGNIQGHCGIEFLYRRYRACLGSNSRCGLLQCEGGSFIGSVAEPVHHNSINVTDDNGVVHTCLSFTPLLQGFLFIQPTFVSRGTPCGRGMV